MPYGSNADLPKGVKVLPASAQAIWRNAFNASYEKSGEEKAIRIAWGAVKNAGYKKSAEGTWTKDEKVYLETIALDAGANVRITSSGFLVAHPRVARTGIQIYKGYELGRPSMDEVRVFRPEEEVFSKDSVVTYTSRPVTNDHPNVLVTADNWKEYAAGQTGEEILRDGEFIRIPMTLMDKKAINDYKEGKRELSLGYTMDLLWGEGETEDGQAFDAVQSNIRANHLALVAKARGGHMLRFGDVEDEEVPPMEQATRSMVLDGLTIQLNDLAHNVVDKVMRSMQGTIDALTEAEKKKKKEHEDELAALKKKSGDAEAALATKDAECATVKKQLEDAQMTPAKLDALVVDRSSVITKAKQVLGDKLVIDAKTNADIRRQVVNSKLGDVAKDWNDDQVKSSFDTLTAGIQATSGTGQNILAAALSSPNLPVADSREKAYEEYNTRIESAWKNNKAAA